MKDLTFATLNLDLGTIKWRSSNHRLDFPFTGDDSMIEEIIPSCSCTAEPYIENGSIIALYTNTSKEENFTNGNELSLTNHIFVYIRDGLPLKVKNEKGQLIYNTNKKVITLSFTCKVVK